MNSHSKNFAKISSSERLSAEDRAAINKFARENLPAILAQLLPGGDIRGQEYVVRNPRRADKKAGSFKIAISGPKTGVWADFATGDKGGDAISLVAYIERCSREEAARVLLRLLNSRHAPQTCGGNTAAREQTRVSGSGKRNSVGSRSASAIEVIPPPPDAEAPILLLQRLGLRRPDASWSYRLEDGSKAFHVLRWNNRDGSKDIRPLSWCRGSGEEGWRFKAWTDPRPPYHLDEIARNPSASVLVCEGEKSADAAARVYGRSVVTTTSSGGAGSAAKTDWTPLAGRKVRIWPDADGAGLKYAEEVAGLLSGLGCKVSIIDAMALASMTPEGERRSPEEGWDAADAIKDWTDLYALWDAVKSCVTRCEAGPAYVSWGPYKMSAGGLTKRGDNPERPIWISSAFEVAAKSRDARGKNWGKWVRFVDGDGRVHCRHVPDAHMQGDPAFVCGPLADEGLTIGPNGQRDLVAYLAGAKSTTRATVVDRTGWHEVGGRLCFVLPGEIIGPKGAEFVILEDAAVGPYEARGTLEDWQDGVGKMAGEHYLAALAVCGSLAGPLLRAAGQEGGGVHFFFVSSTGKTTLLRLAASAWGRGSSNGYLRGWRATANGLEGAAASANDTVLILDEVGVLEAREASASLYELANGLGKSRMNRDTSLRKTKTWDVFVLSSGEIAMAAKVAEHGGKKPRAGQEVRMVDVSADRGGGFGAFSHAGTYADAGKLADAMKRAATTNYGTAGPEFVRRIVRFGFDKAGDVARRRIAEFAGANVPEGADGQVRRVANRFGLMAAAGELATELGVTRWRRGLATASAAWAFRKWMAERGGAEAAETRQAVAQVRLFIEQYGDSRFDPLGESEARPANNRAGWREGTGPSRQWFIPPETWKSELCAGLDPKFVAKTLSERGMLKRAKDGHQSVVKIEGTAKRVYVITARIFDGSADNVE